MLGKLIEALKYMINVWTAFQFKLRSSVRYWRMGKEGSCTVFNSVTVFNTSPDNKFSTSFPFNS